MNELRQKIKEGKVDATKTFSWLFNATKGFKIAFKRNSGQLAKYETQETGFY